MSAAACFQSLSSGCSGGLQEFDGRSPYREPHSPTRLMLCTTTRVQAYGGTFSLIPGCTPRTRTGKSRTSTAVKESRAALKAAKYGLASSGCITSSRVNGFCLTRLYLCQRFSRTNFIRMKQGELEYSMYHLPVWVKTVGDLQ